jgi:hypothetical protein
MTFSIHLATALSGVLAVASLSPARDAASPTPHRVLGASLALWAGLSLALAAFVMPRVLSPDRSRIAWGFAGATLAVGALATVFLRSGAPQVLRKAVVSRPAFVTSGSSLN